ncbi:MAG: gliding motility-associated C-terminal domain-containing protein, partial [Bacteroidetes bacterium]|nr:gliding motility-associated C-terminal domain-containing protein [Bacteroidota bacterium]
TATATDILGNTSGFGDCYTLSEDKSFVDSIDIPQAFTPGNDGFNDRFIIPNISNYPDNELIVLNRWGNQVYYSRPYKNDWTGTTSNGNDLLEGTYFYVLRIFINGNRNIKRGTITIVR